jgi:hypothetical protein
MAENSEIAPHQPVDPLGNSCRTGGIEVPEVRLDVEDRRSVDGIQTTNPNAFLLDGDELDTRQADGIRPVLGALREDSNLWLRPALSLPWATCPGET